MPSIEDQIKKILKDKKVLVNAKFDDGKNLTDVLVIEANNLKDMIADEIRNYYSSYTPVVYQRNDSKSMDKMLKIKVNKADTTISVFFDPDVSWGESVITHEKNGYIPLLIDQGWTVKDSARFRSVHHFGYYEGYHFIEKAITKFKAGNKYSLNIKVIANYGGKHVNAYNNL